MPKIFITRNIPESGIKMLRDKGYELVINPKDRVLSKSELIKSIKGKNYDAVLCLLTDKIDQEVFDASSSSVKIFANYAVGTDNIDLKYAATKNILISNTPDVLTNSVAEHAFALILSISKRIVEADDFMRTGKYKGWEPKLLLGSDVYGKTLGIVGLGRIGARVAHFAINGFGMRVLYYDPKRNENFEKDQPGATYTSNLDDVLKGCDYISIHVPLLPTTKHLINEEKLKLMKPTAYLINTSRGPIVDEIALSNALKNNTIKGAALDVFEFEPKLYSGLKKLKNIIVTPHTASATIETRESMSKMCAENIIAALEGKTPPNLVKI